MDYPSFIRDKERQLNFLKQVYEKAPDLAPGPYPHVYYGRSYYTSDIMIPEMDHYDFRDGRFYPYFERELVFIRPTKDGIRIAYEDGEYYHSEGNEHWHSFGYIPEEGWEKLLRGIGYNEALISLFSKELIEWLPNKEDKKDFYCRYLPLLEERYDET